MKRWIAGVLCAVWLMNLPMMTASAQESTVAAFVFDNTDAVTEVGLKDDGYGDKDTGYKATTGDGLLFASLGGDEYRKLEWSKDDYAGEGLQPVMTGGNRHPWGDGAYLEVQVCTKGYTAITFSAELGGTNKGPRDFTLQYSVDGKTYIEVASYAISDNKIMERAFHAVALPDEAAGCDTLYIRLAVASERLIDGTSGLIGTTSGETAINFVYVGGVADATAPAAAGAPFRVWVAIGTAIVAVAVVIVVIVVRKMRKR